MHTHDFSLQCLFMPSFSANMVAEMAEGNHSNKKKSHEYDYESAAWPRRITQRRKWERKVAAVLPKQTERKWLGAVRSELSLRGCPPSAFLWRWLYLLSTCCLWPAVDFGPFRFQHCVSTCWTFYLHTKLSFLAQHVCKHLPSLLAKQLSILISFSVNGIIWLGFYLFVQMPPYIKTHPEKPTIPETWACVCTPAGLSSCSVQRGTRGWDLERKAWNEHGMAGSVLCSSHKNLMLNTKPGRFIHRETCGGLQISWLGSK